MVHSLQILLSLAIVTLIAVIIIALVRRNRFWRMVRRSLRNKIDLIYDIREQHATLSQQFKELLPPVSRIGDALDTLASRKDLSAESRVQLERALRAMQEIRSAMPRVRALLQLPDEGQPEGGTGPLTKEDEEFTDRLFAIFQQRMSDERFNVAALASMMGMSRSQLFKRVREVTGESPKQLLNEVRLLSAERLLLEGQMTVSEVADATGWNSVSYFSKSFKRRFGLSPTGKSGK